LPQRLADLVALLSGPSAAQVAVHEPATASRRADYVSPAATDVARQLCQWQRAAGGPPRMPGNAPDASQEERLARAPEAREQLAASPETLDLLKGLVQQQQAA
jgi:hypothetical protein